MGKQMNNLLANQTHHRAIISRSLSGLRFHSKRDRSENGFVRLRTSVSGVVRWIFEFNLPNELGITMH